MDDWKENRMELNYYCLVGFLLTFSFALGYSQLANNVVIVSHEQWRDSAIRIHVPFLPQGLLPSQMPHNMEQSSMCCTAGPCWLSILKIAVYTCPLFFHCLILTWVFLGEAVFPLNSRIQFVHKPGISPVLQFTARSGLRSYFQNYSHFTLPRPPGISFNVWSRN